MALKSGIQRSGYRYAQMESKKVVLMDEGALREAGKTEERWKINMVRLTQTEIETQANTHTHTHTHMC